MTITSEILRATAQMRKAGSFETASLCWGAAELEALAMYAVYAKNELSRARAALARLHRSDDGCPNARGHRARTGADPGGLTVNLAASMPVEG